MEQKPFIIAPGTFPLNAADLKLFKYAAPGTINRQENEEAAVRLLMYSQKEGNYVGVAWNILMQQAAQEAMTISEHNELATSIHDANYLAMKKYNAQQKVRRNWALCTFGISLIFMESPVKPMQKSVPQMDSSVKDLFSVVSLWGAASMQMLINAFHDLKAMGLILIENHDGTDYFIPTPGLVAKIAKV